MDIILIPGFWLDASSWDEVIPALRQVVHRVQALTLPGMESKDADRSQITLRDHIDVSRNLEQVSKFVASELFIVHDYRR